MRVVMMLMLLIAGGCASEPLRKITPQSTFDPSDYEWSLTKGANVIVGTAWTVLPSGQRKTCETQAIVVPAGRYLDEVMQLRFGSTVKGYKREFGRQIREYVSEDFRIQHFYRKLPCGPNGEFSVGELPDGSYYVTSLVTWEVPSWDWSRPSDADFFMQRVDLKGGEVVHVDLHP